jgi:hypothetical protein
MRKNTFEPLSKEELLKKENEKKEIEARKNSVIKLASECLDDSKFKKYREEFEDYRKLVFKHIAEPMDLEPIKDAHYLRSCVNTVNVLDMLIGKIERDAKNK